MPLDPEVRGITRGMLRAPSERPIEESMTTPEPRVSQLSLGLAVEQPATLPSIGIAPEWKDQQRLWGHSFHPMCSYLASFPAALAHAFIARYSRRGDVVLDPFSGRGTTPLQASAEGRIGVGNDLNPFAHLLTASKVEPATRAEAMTRLAGLRLAWASESAEWSALAERVAADPATLVPRAGSHAWPTDGVEPVPREVAVAFHPRTLAQLRGQLITDGPAAIWSQQFLFTRCLTIAGGTSEIQRNIIAERVLGLPKDP